MKLFLLAAMVISSSAFARGSDYDWSCRVTGVNRQGSLVRFTTGPLHGGMGAAHLQAIRACKANDLTNCTASCTSIQ